MGSQNSRPTREDPSVTVEKPGFPRETTGASEGNKSSPLPYTAHSSTDRLYRIAAEAGIRNESRPASATLDVASFGKWQQRIDEDPVARLAGLTLHNADIKSSLRSRKAETLTTHVFNTVIDHDNNPITNQQNSGRCWLFATTNLIRNEMMKTLNTDDFQLSQSYLFFWDKIEKSNYFLESTLDLYDRPVDDRVFSALKEEPVNDGGQWDMAASLLSKYGVVPQAVYPESRNSSASGAVDGVITTKLRHGAVQLRKLKRDTVDRLVSSGVHTATAEARADDVCRRVKNEIVEEVYKILSLCCGPPPKPTDAFVFEFRDKDGKFVRVESDAKAFFAKYAPKFDPTQYVSLVHDPRHAERVLLTVDRLGNVKEGNPIRYVSASMQELKDSLVRQVSAGVPVFFGVDVGQSSNSQLGIMDSELYDLEAAFGVDLSLSKAERIEMGESAMTHAMVVTGVHLERGHASSSSSSSKTGQMVRCKVENSWGPDVGHKGYFVATSKWFDDYVFQVVIRKDFVSKDLWALFERGVDDKTVVLPPYDPLGALAQW
ncbi:unnamed protein product [Parajaminaea phylloscopi]